MLREELVAVATGLLAEGGSPAVTTRAVAAGGGTSLAAVNELFGGKAGLVRALFAEGFGWLAQELEALGPDAGVLEVALAVRDFARRRPHLYEVMFSRPFAEFRPGPEDARASEVVHRVVMERVAAEVEGDVKDAAIGLFAVVQGLVAMETAGLLGSTAEAAERRFRVTVEATLKGFS